MPLPASPGPEHDAFIAWAQARGVTINGVAPARLPGRGLGVVATREVKEGDVLVSVPANALLTIETKHVKDAALPAGEDSTVHGRLAAYLTVMHADDEVEWDVWRRVWPSRESFEESMPLCWEEREKDCLPAPARDHLAKQEAKLDADWQLLRDHLPDPSDRRLYTYYWMIVNTRTFFWDYPTSTSSKPRAKKRKLVPDDCMALCPFMEYFNHADEGCTVAHTKAGFTITSHRAYSPGEEIHVSYGAHTNEFLLVEYGFVLAANKWDDVRLDPVILPKLNTAQTELLRTNGFLGDYAVTPDECCHRTQVAVRALLLSKGRAEGFLMGLDSGEKEQEQVDAFLVECAEEYLKMMAEKEQKVERLDEGERKSALQRRWTQVRQVLEGLRATLTR
ncbi:uncharacterized protein J3D65DRAFT_553925 [Phyllosticta citribraziliensis]|uniref:SET domain-containing protein n=1 Tax=Phyllosticta citribraziliensis TaxID=989973 RepID=A0ABR1LPV6_9PEZI